MECWGTSPLVSPLQRQPALVSKAPPASAIFRQRRDAETGSMMGEGGPLGCRGAAQLAYKWMCLELSKTAKGAALCAPVL